MTAVMQVQPISLATANSLVAAWHRHSDQTQGHLWSLGLFDADFALHGAVITGRPVAKALDDGTRVEITRCVTDGTRNACSRLYAAACREARRRGYQWVITYTLATETGASVRAAGFQREGHITRGRQWTTPTRPRRIRPAHDRIRWGRAA